MPDRLGKERKHSSEVLVLATTLSAVLILAVIAGTISTAMADLTQTGQTDENLSRAVKYLYDNYNETIGLNYNSPNQTDPDLQNTYWVYSDNYLVSYILRIYDPDNANWTGRALNITNKMKDYLDSNSSITDHINQYMVLTESEPIDESVSYFQGSLREGTEVKKGDDYVIKTHINNLTDIHPAPEDYSDIAFLQAVYNYWLSNRTAAIENYTYGFEGFDGKGFADKAFVDEYQTYKLALYIHASKLLGINYDERANATLRAMQQPDGGFRTGYDSDLNAKGFTNMETTSLAVLALNQTMSQAPIPEFGIVPLVVVVLLVAVVLTIGARRRKA